MCGRFTVTVTNELLEQYLQESFGIEESPKFDLPRYNVAPGQDIIAIINDGKNNRVGTLHWGFVPPFAKDEKIGYSMINAKSETLMEKPSFKPSFKSKRCLILADSFYEWARVGKEKKPYRFLLNEESLFTMAGLYTTYTREDGSKLHSCTIITTEANDLLKDIHERMPVIIDANSRETWLNPNIHDMVSLPKLLTPYNPKVMKRYEVSQIVNHAKNDFEECIKPIR